jgi:GNAT superfamily N-acetyltransferase
MREFFDAPRTNEDGAAISARLARAASLQFEEGVESLASRLNEAADLYCGVFNSIPEIEPKWNADCAALFLRDRLRRPTAISVLAIDGNLLAAACIAVLDRKAGGVWIADADLMVGPAYRCRGIGGALYYRAHLYAERLACEVFGERPSMIEFSTYRRPDYPKNWWLSLGHKSFPVFSGGIASGLTIDASMDMAVRAVMQSDIDRVASFMEAPNACDIDGSVWTKPGAVRFLEFAVQNSGCLLRFAVRDGEIAGVIAADLVMRRGGPFLTHLACIERRPSITGCIGALLADIASAANTRSLAAFSMRVAGLELTQCQARQLKPFLPDIRQDSDFIGMSMPFDQFMAAMRPRVRPFAPAIAEPRRQNRKSPHVGDPGGERNRCGICSEHRLPLDPFTGRRFVLADPRECGKCGAVVTG